MNKVIAMMAFCFLAACSNQQLYQAIQENRQQECRRTAPNRAVYEECMRASNQSFEDYERQRQELLNDSRDSAPAFDTP